jgi:hypothetical protein
MLYRVDWQLVTDVSGQAIGPTFKSQAVQEELDCLPLEDEMMLLETPVPNCQLTLYNIPEERKNLIVKYSFSLYVKG